MPENRPKTGGGRFKPGQSGNRGGRPKLTLRALEVRALCREASARVVERLTELLEDPDPSVVLKVAAEILNRAWGSPGTEADVREVDTDRAEDAEARRHGHGGALADLAREAEPPVDVD